MVIIILILRTTLVYCYTCKMSSENQFGSFWCLLKATNTNWTLTFKISLKLHKHCTFCAIYWLFAIKKRCTVPINTWNIIIMTPFVLELLCFDHQYVYNRNLNLQTYSQYYHHQLLHVRLLGTELFFGVKSWSVVWPDAGWGHCAAFPRIDVFLMWVPPLYFSFNAYNFNSFLRYSWLCQRYVMLSNYSTHIE